MTTTESRMGSTKEIHMELMDKVLEKNNLRKALERVEENEGAPGIDEMTVGELRPYLKENWLQIKEQILAGTYKPKPVRRVEIPKPDGGKRALGIPTVLDRFIQQAIQQVLTPIFDEQFSEHSYGFRIGRNAHMAVKQAQNYIQEGYNWVVDVDIENFFNTMHHDLIMARVAKKVGDKLILRLIRRYLQSGVMINGVCVATEEGAPQGGPLSPLLANIMLDDLDKELTKRGHRFVRYADDCNIYVKSERAGQRVMESVKSFLEKKLKLKISLKKSAVDKPGKRKFLGFSFTNDNRIRIAPKSLERLKDKIRGMTKPSESKNITDRIKKLSEYLSGWLGYFQLTETRSVLEKIDKWTRRRLRVCLLEQWKQPKTRARELKALGLREDWAYRIGYSRKGSWRLTATKQMHTATNLEYWSKMGLRSLVEQYDRLRYAL